MMYDQSAIIDKLNDYLKLNNRKLVLSHGYCHGLTLLWLYKMSEKKEKWFYETIKKIVDASKDKISEIEMDIEKFLAHIEWLQQPEKYVPSIRQMDIDKSTEIPKELPLSSVFNPSQLDTVLNMTILPDKMICISGPDHSIGVVLRKGKYYLYNPNYVSGEAKELDSALLLRYELIQCLFADFDHPTKNLAITINVMGGDDMTQEKNNIRTWIMKATGVMNFCDYGICPLYLACENHDVELVQLLLEKDAKPNIPTKDNRYPLLLSCYSGYVDQVELLLKHGADPNLLGREGLPLYVASKNGHDAVIRKLLENGALINYPDKDGETAIFGSVQYDQKHITKLLLESGANPLWANKYGDTPMDIAIENKDWGTVGMMLLFIESPHTRNIEKLKLNNTNIVEALDRLVREKMIAEYENKQIAKLLNEITSEKAQIRKTTKHFEAIRRDFNDKSNDDLNRNRFFHLINPEIKAIEKRSDLTACL